MRGPNRIALIAALPLVLSLSACNDDAPAAPQAEQTAGEDLEDLLEDEGDFSTFARFVENTELDEVLGGPAPYTLLAPANDAFADMGEGEINALSGANMRAQATAFVMAHLMPGFISLEDLRKSIADSNGDGVSMKSMAGDMIEFRMDGERITVSSGDGVSAAIVSDLNAGNGGILVIDQPLISRSGDGTGE